MCYYPHDLKEHCWILEKPFYPSKRFCVMCRKWIMTCDHLMVQWTCPNCLKNSEKKTLDTLAITRYNDDTTLT